MAEHPQAEVIAFLRGEARAHEIQAALRIVEAARGAERDGVGAFLVDGRMIDVPFVRRAESILAAARRLKMTAVPEA